MNLMMNIPEWEMSEFVKIAVINYGKSPNLILSENGQYPVIGTGGNDRTGEDYLFDGESIIIGRKGTIDRVNYVSGKFWVIDTAYYLSNFVNVIPKWLYYFLQTIDLRQLNEATGVPSLSRDALYKIKMNVPTLSEQNKIAEILEILDQSIHQTEELIAKQERIKKGLIQVLLTNGIDENGMIRSEETHEFIDSSIGRIPASWGLVNLGDCLELIRNGYSGKQISNISEYPVSRIETISNGEIDLNRIGYVENIPKSYLLKNGDILFSNINSLKHIGKVAYIGSGINLYHGMNLLVLRASNQVDSKFLYYMLVESKSWFEKMAAQAVNQASINQVELKKLQLKIPSDVEEQIRIVNILNKTEKTIQEQYDSLAKQNRLRDGLLKDLLTGKKRVTPLLNETEVIN